MRFARIIYQYRYDLSQTPEDDLWPGDGNLGDCMQSLAVENICGKIGIPESELLHVNRDDIKKYNGEKCALYYAGVVWKLCQCFSIAVVGKNIPDFHWVSSLPVAPYARTFFKGGNI